MAFNPASEKIGGFSENDGTIDYYSRINCLVNHDSYVLDYGAGRGGFIEDKCDYRRELRLLKGKVKHIIGCDVDEAIFLNKTVDETILMKNQTVPVPDYSFDLINSDYVLEHIDNPKFFSSEINRLLKPGGWFCARTPHKYCYISLFAELFKNNLHAKILKFVQPNRQIIDIFPTKYKLNTRKALSKYFPNYKDKTFIYRCEPSYYFNNKYVYKLEEMLSRIAFKQLVGNLFIFLQKPYT